jgi:hypothetical protein
MVGNMALMKTIAYLTGNSPQQKQKKEKKTARQSRSQINAKQFFYINGAG